jgi:hypothetical protein
MRDTLARATVVAGIGDMPKIELSQTACKSHREGGIPSEMLDVRQQILYLCSLAFHS